MNPVSKLQSYFGNKNQYEQRILICSLKIKNDRDIQEDIKDVKKNGTFTKEELKYFDLVRSTALFKNEVEKLLKEIEIHLNEKLDTVADDAHKRSYLIQELDKLREVAHSTCKIYAEYPEVELSDKTPEDLQKLYDSISRPPLPKGLLINADVILNHYVKHAEKLTKLNPHQKIPFYKDEEVLSITLSQAFQEIERVNNQLIESYSFLLPVKDYEIKTDFHYWTIIQKPKPKRAGLYYWRYNDSELEKLYDLLLAADKIEENPQFVLSFSKLKVDKAHRTGWKKSKVELVYMFYLIYGVALDEVRIHRLISNLFTNKKGNKEFTEKGLSTALTDNQTNFDNKKPKLTPSLVTVKKIVEQLDLTEPSQK